MTFFLATVPAGTQLYHGTWNPGVVKGIEWLAFEPEHALVFARPRRGPPLPPGDGGAMQRDGPCSEEHAGQHAWKHPHSRPQEPCPKDGHNPPSGPDQHDYSRPLTSTYHQPPPPDHHRRYNMQEPLSISTVEQDVDSGYLHTYVPKNTLRLLYVDGLSAGKTENGTLDTQDMILLNISERDGPMGGEYERARGMCNLASSLWGNKIDGILRMEAGFEIILCDFEQHLERTDVITVGERNDHRGPRGFMGGWRYIQAVASRYHGIGGQRVTIDYEDFVSVFAYDDIDGLFTNDVQSDYPMPRLQNVNKSTRDTIKTDITDMILRKDWADSGSTRDWQRVADMVIERYAKPLHQLHTDQALRKDKDASAAYLAALLEPFVSVRERNASLEMQRCVSQLVPPLPLPPRPAASLAHRTLHVVTSRICDVLLTALSITSSPASHSTPLAYASHAAALADELFEYLNWSTWKECGTCADDEVCYVPIWPMGSHEDHAHPRCRGEEDASSRRGYWGSRHGPPKHR
ncbi:hypothetical protein ACN47E_001363 [Coniothyrium glycines]